MTTQGSLAWRARVDERITMPKGNIGQHDLDTPISASRRIAFTRPLEVPKFHLQQSQQALQGRLCEITAPILRGIDLPLMRIAIIEAALGFMKQPPAAKNTVATFERVFEGRERTEVTRASREASRDTRLSPVSPLEEQSRQPTRGRSAYSTSQMSY